MKNKIILLFLLCFTSFLTVAFEHDNSSAIQSEIQQELDRRNPNGNLGICYYLGDMTLPYQLQKSSPDDHKYTTWVNNELGRRLALFQQLGLLVQSPVSSNRYELTDEGRTYYKNHSFCFGQVVLTEVKPGFMNTRVQAEGQFYYQVKNIPDWARSELFTRYFYYYQDEESVPKFLSTVSHYRFQKIPPFLKDEQAVASMSFTLAKKQTDGWMLESGLLPQYFAFYDQEVAFEEGYTYETEFAWGGGDPILHKINRKEHAALIFSNNALMQDIISSLGPIYRDTVISQVEIEYITEDMKVKKSIYYNTIGLLTSIYIDPDFVNEFLLSSRITKSMFDFGQNYTWYYTNSISYGGLSSSSNAAVFNSNSKGQIINTTSKDGLYHNGRVTYDNQLVTHFVSDELEYQYVYARVLGS